MMAVGTLFAATRLVDVPTNEEGGSSMGRNLTVFAAVFLFELVVGSGLAYGLSAPVRFEHNGHWYALDLTCRTWTEARDYAATQTFVDPGTGAQLVGHLVTVQDAEENAFLQSLIAGSFEMMWIGARRFCDDPGDLANNWAWVTDEVWSYTNWDISRSQPNSLDEDFARLGNFWGGRWHDFPDEESSCGKLHTVVEYEASLNRPPDCSGAIASVTGCWPPNHKFTLVDVLGVTDPDGDPITIAIDSIAQDEPVEDTGRGSGPACPDGVVVDTGGGSQAAGVRCERDGTGDGRVYTINFTASDGNGSDCSCVVTFCVPHDKKAMCVDDGPAYDSTVCPESGAGARARSPTVLSLEEFTLLTPDPLFMRGDVNWDDEVDLADGISVLNLLFRTSEPFDCPDAADVNDDGFVDISDATAIFSYRFLGALAPRPPTLVIGIDPTPDELGCPTVNPVFSPNAGVIGR